MPRHGRVLVHDPLDADALHGRLVANSIDGRWRNLYVLRQ
jgi:hypothetical protein